MSLCLYIKYSCGDSSSILFVYLFTFSSSVCGERFFFLISSFSPASLFLSPAVLSTRLLKSRSNDSLLNSDMDTAPTPITTNHNWLDGLGAEPKEIDSASSHSAPQTQEAFLSPLINKSEMAEFALRL